MEGVKGYGVDVQEKVIIAKSLESVGSGLLLLLAVALDFEMRRRVVIFFNDAAALDWGLGPGYF